MPDITMSLNDKLELDTIIKESNIASDPISSIKYEGSDSTVHNFTGFQTHTGVFDPQESGNYTITINGQTLSIKVTDTSTIPESGLLHNYDFSVPTTTANFVEDQKSGDELDTGSITQFGTINSTQAASFSETDSITGDFATALSEPYDIFIVGRFDTIKTDNHIAFDGANEFVHVAWSRNENWGIFQGADLVSSTTSDTENHIFASRFDTKKTDTLRIDGSEIVSGNAGSNNISGITVGDDHEYRDNGADSTIGQILVYNPTADGYSVSNVEKYLSDKWDIKIL